MYYSIPGILKAERLLKDVDYSDIAALADSEVQAAPSDQQRENRGKVSRKTRISYEVHTDLLLEEMFDDLVEVERQEDGDDDSDRFGAIVSMFRMT